MADGKKWKRVVGPNLEPQHDERRNENQKIFNKEVFKNACEAAGVEPTIRQASKFKNKKGIAFTFGKIKF